MKSKSLSSENKKGSNRVASKKSVGDSSFEKDWANGVSGDVFWQEAHQHLEKLQKRSPKVSEKDTFEADWANGVSGEEVVGIVHEQIKVWWCANKENKKA